MTNLVHLKQLMDKPRFQRQLLEEGSSVDARGLAAALRQRIDGEVRFDRGSRALYATDGSNYRQVPIGVVIPRSVEDVIQTVQACREHGAPLLSRGGGTSLAGQSCNVAVIMDFSKYLHHVLQIDPQRKLARVEPGCVLDTLRHTAERDHLTFGPDPATHSRCALGGMLGNNSCGSHSHLCSHENRGYRTSDNTHQLDILTYGGVRMRVGPTSAAQLEAIIQAGGPRGEIYAALKHFRDKYAPLIREKFPKLPRRVSGYNLDELLPENNQGGFHLARALVGTESTCITILEATVHLVHSPPARSLLILGYPDVFHAGDHVMDILPFKPTACEGVDQLLFEWEKQRGGHDKALELLPEGHGWLYVEFGGESKQEADAAAQACMAALKKQPNAPTMKLFDDRAQEKMLWEVREGSLGATAWVPGHKDTWEGFEDSSVPPEHVGRYLRQFKGLLDKYEYDTSLYGHLAQGCVHCRIPFDFYTVEGVEKYRRFMDEATDLVLSFGGSLSGEHGDGQSRAQFLPRMYGEEMVRAFGEFKHIWDPQDKMNPGKVVHPYSITDNLRLGPDYNPPQPQTFFKYPNDKQAFSRAILRCVGIGACRNESGQTMCPSYMVTREEKHSTRGRARLLWEMMNGDVLPGGWRSEEVKNALDLCLSCKGCKHDCPVNVDMATYKAEFLAHYYKGRLRPRHAFAFGFIHVWSRLASIAPGLVNLFTQTPGIRTLAKMLAGMHPRREIPAFAPQTFQAWFRERPRRFPSPKNGDVMLFADTFNNFFSPETAIAAVEALEHARFQVHVPMQDVCCGRPLFDYGFVPTARRWLEHLLQTLQPEIQAGLPMVVLEPSCAAVFRDELGNLFPTRKDAQHLAQNTFLLGEFLVKRAGGFRPPQLRRKALLHGHCHHKAIMGLDDERKILKEMGVEFREPEKGCCGMAGAFGYEPGDHYRVSIANGNRHLIPAVKGAAPDEIILADGFSCREQIHQQTSRQALHLAQVLELALRAGPAGPAASSGPPERRIVARRRSAQRRASFRTLAVAAGIAVAGFAAWRVYRKTRAPAARRGARP